VVTLDYFLVYMGIGVFTGLMAGLLGVGGGAIAVPLLLWVFDLQEINSEIATHMALATALAAMVLTSISSTYAHASKKAVLWPVFFKLNVGVIFGSIIGVVTVVEISGSALQIAFGIFLACLAIQMAFGLSPAPSAKLPSGPGLLGAGGVIGCVSMFFGIGGGSLTVPFLIYSGVTPVKAIGTSAALGLPIAVWGTVLYAANGWNHTLMPEYSFGFVYGPAVTGIIIISPIFARLGAKIAHRMNSDQLRQAFGVTLAIVAGMIVLQNLSRYL
jgi:uncharacterized membrane protein YfcA